MIFTSILILIVAIALPSINKKINPSIFTRISSIVFIYAGALSFNAFYIQSIGSGIGIYSGLYQVTALSQLLDSFIFIIGSLILIAWPTITNPSSALAGPSLGSGSLSLPTSPSSSAARVEGGIESANIEYSLIVLFSTLGASLLISSADLISMYLSIELQSFGVYILSTLYRDSESATSAGLKYFLLGCLSSCLILLGAGLIYSFTGLTNFESIYSLVSVSDSNTITQGLSLGLIIIIVGFLFKIAAAPLHNWAPDVYDDSPTIVTIWLTIMPKISIIIFILEIYTQIGSIGNSLYISILPGTSESVLDYLSGAAGSGLPVLMSSNSEGSVLSSSDVLKTLLLISSLLSLIIGTVVGLAQSKIKRLLSYSTISHVGFILLALAINTEQSVDSLIFYIIQYSITNLNTFLIIIALGYIIHNYDTSSALKAIGNTTVNSDGNTAVQGTSGKKDIKLISELKGQFFSNPLLSLSLTVSLFSMAGIPPLMGFFSKQFVLYSAIQSGYYFMSIIGIIVSVISAAYYLKIIRVLLNQPIAPVAEQDHQTLGSVAATASLPSSFAGHVEAAAESGSDVTLNSSALADANPTPASQNQGEEVVELTITNFHSFMISTFTLSILFFVLKPSILLNSTQLLSLSLFNY